MRTLSNRERLFLGLLVLLGASSVAITRVIRVPDSEPESTTVAAVTGPVAPQELPIIRVFKPENGSLLIGDSMVLTCPWPGYDQLGVFGGRIEAILEVCKKQPRMHSKAYDRIYILVGNFDAMLYFDGYHDSDVVLQAEGQKVVDALVSSDSEYKTKIESMSPAELHIERFARGIRRFADEGFLDSPEKLDQMVRDAENLLAFVRSTFRYEQLRIVGPFPDKLVGNYALIQRLNSEMQQTFGGGYFDVSERFINFDTRKPVQPEWLDRDDEKHLSVEGFEELRRILDQMELSRGPSPLTPRS